MLFKDFSLEGKTAIITGAGRGIGQAIAVTFAEAGADVVSIARTRTEIEHTAAQVRQLGRKAIAVPADLTREDEVRSMVEKTLQEFGRIDILVNNAGTVLIKPIIPIPSQRVIGSDPSTDLATPITETEWRRVVDLNLTATFLCCRAVGPYMIKQGGGRIINITSGYAAKVAPNRGPYAASKAAVAMFTRSLALEWARYNINVNAIGPGLIRTEQSEGFFKDEELLQSMLKALPLRRVGEARDVGLLAVYLASEASRNMTGQNIYLDQGLSIS